jgi:hypothetical protein
MSHTVDAVVTEVCVADAVYAVLYLGKPIKIRTHNPAMQHLGYKYGKSMFPESGHAIRLASKLNEIYNTDEFTVGVMVQGRNVKLQP